MASSAAAERPATDAAAPSIPGGPPPPVRPGESLISLAAVRIVPALMIFIAHVTQYHLFTGGTVQSLFSVGFNKVGYQSVSFFVVLSGFIITWVSLRQGKGRIFTARRFLKILPTHAVMWLVCLLVLGSTSAGSSALNLLLLHGWSWNPQVFFTVNIPAWTLCVEVLFYAAFPLLLPLLARRSDRALWWLLGTLVAVTALIPAVLSLLPDGTRFTEPAFLSGSHQMTVPQWKFWFVYIFPPSRLVESLIGVVLCLLVARGKWTFRSTVPALVLLVATITASTLWSPFLYALSAETIIPIVLFIGALAAADRSRGPNPFRIRRLAKFAPYTFSFYLAQWVIITTWKQDLLPAQGYGLASAVGVFVALFGLTALLALALHKVVERPITRRTIARLKARWGADAHVVDAHGTVRPRQAPAAFASR